VDGIFSEIRPDWVALQLQVIIVKLRAQMMNEYLCGTGTANYVHITHKIDIRDKHRMMKRVRALIDSSATCIVMGPSLH